MKAVGVTYGNRQRVISRLNVGDTLRFVPEPENPYDHCAVRIETANGEDVGFISKDHNYEFFRNITQGLGEYTVTVSSITGGGFNANYGLNMHVVFTPNN